ncbi:hypothetical protein LTSEWAN_1449, partial [Salmonella enterica subsp. enterica serovar Wandsworth str. A4-580]
RVMPDVMMALQDWALALLAGWLMSPWSRRVWRPHGQARPVDKKG